MLVVLTTTNRRNTAPIYTDIVALNWWTVKARRLAEIWRRKRLSLKISALSYAECEQYGVTVPVTQGRK